MLRLPFATRPAGPGTARIAPVSWLVAHDVEEGREHLNFSDWNRYPRGETRRAAWRKIWEEVEEGEMPLWFYLPLHPEAKLSQKTRSSFGSGRAAGPGRPSGSRRALWRYSSPHRVFPGPLRSGRRPYRTSQKECGDWLGWECGGSCLSLDSVKRLRSRRAARGVLAFERESLGLRHPLRPLPRAKRGEDAVGVRCRLRQGPSSHSERLSQMRSLSPHLRRVSGGDRDDAFEDLRRL